MSKYLDGAIAGDAKVMEAFLADIAPEVRKMITRSVADHDDIEAIKQDVLIRVWRHIKDFQKGSELSTWLYRIVVNSTNTHLSSKQEDKFVSIDDLGDDVLEADPFITLDSPEELLIREEEDEERAQAILAIMGKAHLSAMQHKAMFLHLFHDMPNSEKAQILKCSEKDVENYLYQATQKMAAYKDEIRELSQA